MDKKLHTISGECGNIKVVTAMEGHESVVDMNIHYTNLKKEVILKHYLPIIPFLSFEKTKVNIVNDEVVEEVEKLKKQLIGSENARLEDKKAHELEKAQLKVDLKVEILAEIKAELRGEL
jgi:hypothetical protein